MKTLNFLCTNLCRYIFDFLDAREKILIGFINQRHRKILNLRREFLKLFFFALRIDYKNKLFMSNIVEHMNFFKKKFPDLDEESFIEFVAFYLKCSNEKNKSIVFSTHKLLSPGCDKLSIFDSLNSKLYRDFSNNKEIIFEGYRNKEFAIKLERLNYNFNHYPLKCLEVSNYSVLADVSFEKTEGLTQYINFSKMNPNYFKEIDCYYEEGNEQILNQFLVCNQNATKTLTIYEMDYKLDWLPMNKFHKLRLALDVINAENFTIFKNFTGEIHLECSGDFNGILQDFSELISPNLTNLVSLEVSTKKGFILDLELLTQTNINLRKVDIINDEGDEDDDDDYLFRIGSSLILLNAEYSESFLKGVMSIIERNLVNNDYFRNLCLKGNAKFIIDFLNFLAEYMSYENFKNFFSKISKFDTYQKVVESDFIFQNSTQENINKCFMHMTNLITLKIVFNTELTKYLHIFQFGLLKCLKAFKYETPDGEVTVQFDVLRQLKDIKLKDLSCEITERIIDIEAVAKYQEHLVRFKIKYFEDVNESTLSKESLFEFIAKRNSLNKISLRYEFDCFISSTSKELNENFPHITIDSR